MKLNPLVMTLGTGGVGKTTVSMALAYGLARRGERVFLLTVDPAKRLYDLSQKVAAEIPNLHLVRLDVGRQFAEMVVRHSPDGATAKAVLESRFFPYLTDHLPGFHEYVASEIILESLRSGQYDRLVVDTPPFAYAQHFLEAPERLARMAGLARRVFPGGSGPSRLSPLLMKGLSVFLGGGFLTELLEFISAFSQVWPGIEATAREVAKCYREETSFAAVMVPDGHSTEDLLAFLRGAPDWLNVQYLIVNRAWESGLEVFQPPSGTDVEGLLGRLPACLVVGPSARRELARDVSEAYRLARRMKVAQDEALGRVSSEYPELVRLGVIVLPMLSGGVTGRVSLDWLSDRLLDDLASL